MFGSGDGVDTGSLVLRGFSVLLTPGARLYKVPVGARCRLRLALVAGGSRLILRPRN